MIERNKLDCCGASIQSVSSGAETRIHQQILHASQSLYEKVDALRTAAVSRGEDLPHCVQQHWQLCYPLAISACEAAAIAVNSSKQVELFDKVRTVVEAEYELMNACRNAGGNPKAAEHHSLVDESAANLKQALEELRMTLSKMGNDQGNIQDMVETISHSIASSDRAPSTQQGHSFADAQTSMSQHLEVIRRTASDMPFASFEPLGELTLTLSEQYKQFTIESNQVSLSSHIPFSYDLSRLSPFLLLLISPSSSR